MTFTFRQSAALARVLLVARPSRRPLVTMEAPPPPAGLPYGELARTLDAVEAEPARLDKEALMASLLERAWGASADDLLGCVALTSQQLTPATRPLKLGVGDALVLDALARVCDGDADALKAELRQLGDLGALAAARREGAPPPAEPLTLREVRAAMLEIPADSGKGKGANERKASLVAALLGRAPPLEAQYIVRSIRGKLRSGLGDRSLRAALAQAAAARSPDADPELAAAEAAAAEAAEEAAAVEAEAAADEKELRKAKRKAAAAAKKAEKERGVSRRRAVALVDEAFKVQPCYHQLVDALVTQGVWALDVKERAGMPIQAMTANPALSIDDVLKRFGDAAAFLAEEKYDGERCQVHVIADDAGGAPRVQLFSRQLDEKMTARFPELTAALPAALDGTSAIIDTEIVAYDAETGRPRPFKELQSRPKKAPTQEQLESGELAPVCLLAFDLLQIDGVSLMAEPLRRRRELLRERLTPVPGVLAFAEGVEVATANATHALQSALLDSVERETEGLMLKLLDGDASAYEAGKRSFNWLKLKKDYIDELGDSVDLVPVGGYMGEGRRAGGFGTYLMAAYDDATARYQPVCKLGAGFTDENLAALSAAFGSADITDASAAAAADGTLPEWIDASTLETLPPNYRPDAWLPPQVVWEVRGAMLSVSPVFRAAADLVDENGKGIALRFPRFLRTRDDKAPTDATTSAQLAHLFLAQQSAVAAAAAAPREPPPPIER